MPYPVLGSLDDWSDAVAALPAPGPLPVRTVLVPSERHAHALRRALLASGRGAALAGTRFVRPVELAFELVRAAGVHFTPGEDGLRAARLRVLFDETLPLAHFDLALLRSAPGWDEAFARAIGELEAAGLEAGTLPDVHPALRDLGTIWRAADARAGRSWSAARILREAAALLSRGAAPDLGPVLVAATGHERAVEARFARALPQALIAVHAARPASPRHRARLEALWGPGAGTALEAALDAALAHALAPDPARAGGSERDLVARFLFAPPRVLAAADRPRSAGPDGSVALEEHAGIEEELEAAADWVAREVLDHGTPPEELAILVPGGDPILSLVASRVGRLPWPAAAPVPVPAPAPAAPAPEAAAPEVVHVARGLPLASSTGGARALAVVRALRAFLPAGDVAVVLPALRAPIGERTHLSHDEAMAVAWSLGTAGGHAGHPAGALDWPERLARREVALAAALGRLPEDAPRRDRRGLERRLAELRAAGPALEALVAVARLVVEGRPFAELADAVVGFLEAWTLDPGDGPRVHQRLAERLEAARSDPLATALAGTDALDAVAAALGAIRVPTVRFGAPAVFVGTPQDAAGLSFRAVRILGLREGAVPSAPREDPVLPDALRARLDPTIPLAEDRVAAQLHAFDRAVRAARERLAFSAPRVDTDGTEHEPSALLVEVGAALGRPDAATGRAGPPVPRLGELRRDAFEPARAAARRDREARPLTEGAWQDRAAARGERSPRWSEGAHLALDRIAALRADPPLVPRTEGLVVPGLSPERPISASALQRLLCCPRAFFYERILGWEEPAAAPSLGELDPLPYGTLFHLVMERFYEAHGARFTARERTLPEWQRLAASIAAAALADVLDELPLAGARVGDRELRRLGGDVRAFLAYDWALPGTRRFVAVERPFGDPTPVALDCGGRTLYVHGCIDRLDVEDDHLLVRDLKTGRPHPRLGKEQGPTPVRDVQLALYAIVAKDRAAEWGLPRRVRAAYAYASGRGDPERAFRDDFDALEAAGRSWLALAAQVLAEGAFAMTPLLEDCTFCPFRAVCGDEAPAHADAAIAAAGGALRAFHAQKTGAGEG